MNYFFTYGMFFDTDVLAKYQYWMRLDADSEIMSAEEDPFSHAAKNDFVFAFRDRVYSGGGCNHGLKAVMQVRVFLRVLRS